MAILTPPAAPRYASARFGPQANTLAHVSSLDRSTQTVELPGVRWMFEAALPAMDETEAEAWTAFLSQLGGQAGRFYAGDPWRIAPRGSAKDTPGTPLVAGASQTGSSVAIDGAPLSATGYLLTGDYVAFDLPSGGRSLHKATAQADTDGAGAVTLALYPPLRESPADNAPVILAPATCVMRLINDDQARWDVDAAGHYRIAFAAVETFDDGS